MGRRRHGSIQGLDESIRKEVNALLLANKTYAEIVAFIKQKHALDLSDSSLSRYNAAFMEEVRETEILRDNALWLNDDPDKALILEKLTATMITRRLATALKDGGFDVTSKGASCLIDAFAKLQASSTKRAEFEGRMKDKTEKAATAVAKIAKKGGLSDDTVNDIKAKILGIAK
ncbi:MAG: DUF3486 family protein [Nitrospirae bacterium]|nr:MAG: DUF3486 family protein [Nitrospirota bacterium]